MRYDRPEAKRLARFAMRGAYPHPMLVTLVYVLLTGVLSNVIMYFVSNPFTTAYWYLLDGNYEAEVIFRTLFTAQRVGVYLLIELLLSLYMWVMGFGYASYALRLARREGPGYRNLLDGFACLGRALLVNLLISIFTFLWGLLAMVPYIVVAIIAAVSGSGLLMGLAWVLALAGVVFAVAVSYRYRLAVYFLLDNPEMGVLESITRSKETMRGNKWALFVQDLSFLGWAILSVFTLGILSLWVAPYSWASEANFYHWAVYGSFPAPGPRPDGGYRSSYDGGPEI